MKRHIFLVTLLILVTTSCTKHLDREYAKRQIIQLEKYPITIDYDITKAFTTNMNTEGRGLTIDIGGNDWENQEKIIKSFENARLVTFDETPEREETTVFLLGTTVRTWTSVKVLLTEDGKKYLLNENDNSFKVKLWETSLDDITGIQEMEREKTARVDYTISNKNISLFGEIFSDKNKATQKTIYFSLYDDGWRIK